MTNSQSEQNLSTAGKKRKSVSVALEMRDIRRDQKMVEEMLQALKDPAKKSEVDVNRLTNLMKMMGQRLHNVQLALINKINPAQIWTPANDVSNITEPVLDDIVLHEWDEV